MAVSPGSRLGRYEIVSRIGAGGMGEVYRARDSKLGRDVAIKVLPEAFAQDGDRMVRFEREAKFLRLGQLQDALLRDSRFVVGIKMHTADMSFEDAVAFFEKEGYQSHETGLVETKRGTSDPTYLYYTLGKLEIMKLRDDLRKKEGAAFSLQKFHDAFLSQGFPPIRIVREAMLGDKSPTL